jgi:hypothetical protein
MAEKDLIPFKPGQTGNPGGKPVGARNRLTKAFLNALADDFEKDGKAAIVACRENKPEAYIKAIAALCPKEVEVKRPLEEMSADELLNAVRALESFLAAQPPQEGARAPGSELPTH